MNIELPKDAEGREIPLDTVALFNRVGNVYSIISDDGPCHGDSLALKDIKERIRKLRGAD